MGTLFADSKFVPLYKEGDQTGWFIAFGLLVAGAILLPTIGEPNHGRGVLIGLGYALQLSVLMGISRAALNYNRVARLLRIGDTLQVDLRSFIPGIRRGFTCPLRDAMVWERLGRHGRHDRLVFYYRSKRYYAPLGYGWVDAPGLVEAYPELATQFGIRPRPPAATT